MEDICYGSYFAAETTMTATTPAKSITDLPEATLRHILRFATNRDDLRFATERSRMRSTAPHRGVR